MEGSIGIIAQVYRYVPPRSRMNTRGIVYPLEESYAKLSRIEARRSTRISNELSNLLGGELESHSTLANRRAFPLISGGNERQKFLIC